MPLGYPYYPDAGPSPRHCPVVQMSMPALRDIFINSLCNFTHLHSPSTMRLKNALAFTSMLRVAEAVGDHLQERCGHGKG